MKKCLAKIQNSNKGLSKTRSIYGKNVHHCAPIFSVCVLLVFIDLPWVPKICFGFMVK